MTAHAIPDSLESTIRGHLREITSEEVAIRDISPMTDDVDRFGRPFTARERRAHERKQSHARGSAESHAPDFLADRAK